ncbi:unnamed protein product [Oppiella nova]|uniref:RING-type domain-containing protein n=1 Tax=Oppiella nova TaxID=334625 RepID=A0A7R9LK34_9ACAR|nr:unnamed protein product [Oppiella nova]CAG2164436.1 unnamed protein product [Oppiella nova]
MPGYDIRRFVGLSQREADEFTCGICLQIFREPTVVPCCRHTYCRECISRWLANTNTCPNDRRGLIASQLYDPQRLVTNLLAKLHIQCHFYAQGCDAVLELQCLDSHADSCPCNPCRQCPDCGLRMAERMDAAPDYEIPVPPLVSHNCVNSLKRLNETLAEEMSQLKREILKLKTEIKTLKDRRNEFNASDTLSDHISEVLSSARNRICYPEITYCSVSSTQRLKAINKSKEAILTYDSYEQITHFLSQQFNTSSSGDTTGHKWHTIAQSVHCGEALIATENGWIDLRFGQLRIAIFRAAGAL